MPACQPRIARCCVSATGFSSLPIRTPCDGPGAQLAQIRSQIDGRFWLHLGQDWWFFAPENFITRLTAVLKAEPEVFQVGINFADAVKLAGVCAAEETVRRAPDAGRYLLTDMVVRGPAMFDTARLDRAGGVQGTHSDPIAELGRRAAAAGLRHRLPRRGALHGLGLTPRGLWLRCRVQAYQAINPQAVAIPTSIQEYMPCAPSGLKITKIHVENPAIADSAGRDCASGATTASGQV